MSEEETLLEFPCEFPIKAMGKSNAGLEQIVLDLIKKHAPDTSADNVRSKLSAEGKYISVTVTITAISKVQIDRIYMDITGHADIVMAL